jgi:hypothetical protein
VRFSWFLRNSGGLLFFGKLSVLRVWNVFR